jgi:hypothetical protein
MKITIFFIFLLISISNTYCQSWEIEEQNINKIIQSGKTQLEVQELVKDWRAFRAEYGEYPALPFNDKNELEFTFIFDNQFNKEIIYNRILEWAAINFGALEAVLHYKNLESGKIILKGQFGITYSGDFMGGGFWGNKIEERTSTSNCKQTYIFTIKDNKLKIQVVDVEVVYEFGGYMGVTAYIPSEKYDTPLSNYYPITRSNKLSWKSNLNKLDEVSKRIFSLASDLNMYISDFKNDYSY